MFWHINQGPMLKAALMLKNMGNYDGQIGITLEIIKQEGLYPASLPTRGIQTCQDGYYGQAPQRTRSY